MVRSKRKSITITLDETEKIFLDNITNSIAFGNVSKALRIIALNKEKLVIDDKPLIGFNHEVKKILGNLSQIRNYVELLDDKNITEEFDKKLFELAYINHKINSTVYK